MTTSAEKKALQAEMEAIRDSWNKKIKDAVNAVYLPFKDGPPTPDNTQRLTELQPVVDSLNLIRIPILAWVDAVNAIVVSDPQAPAAPVIASFVATPASIAVGQSTTLTATVTGATSLTLDGVVLAPPTPLSYAFSYIATPATNKTYALIATGPGGMTTASISVTVTPVVVIPPDPNEPVFVKGSFDKVELTGLAWGWASPTGVKVDVYVDDVLVGSTRASKPRPDVDSVGGPNCGWEFMIPADKLP